MVRLLHRSYIIIPRSVLPFYPIHVMRGSKKRSFDGLATNKGERLRGKGKIIRL